MWSNYRRLAEYSWLTSTLQEALFTERCNCIPGIYFTCQTQGLATVLVLTVKDKFVTVFYNNASVQVIVNRVPLTVRHPCVNIWIQVCGVTFCPPHPPGPINHTLWNSGKKQTYKEHTHSSTPPNIWAIYSKVPLIRPPSRSTRSGHISELVRKARSNHIENGKDVKNRKKVLVASWCWYVERCQSLML